jgi:hypothetical protein
MQVGRGRVHTKLDPDFATSLIASQKKLCQAIAVWYHFNVAVGSAHKLFSLPQRLCLR